MGAHTFNVILLCWPPLRLPPVAAGDGPYQIQSCNPYKVAEGSETIPVPSGYNPASRSYQSLHCCFGVVALTSLQQSVVWGGHMVFN